MPAPLFPIPVATAGTLSIMACPPVGQMGAVLDDLQAAGIGVVLSMLPASEARALGAGNEPDLCAQRGIVFLSHPVADFALPEMLPFAGLVADLAQRLKAGAHIAVHCRAGIGRSGMVAACTLVALGGTAAQAVAAVSAARGVSIPDTVEQGKFIAFFGQGMAGD